MLQSYLLLNEVYPAVQAAAKCTEVNPLWWVGHQTLGRAQLGLGDVAMVGMKKSCMIFKGWEASNFLEARGFRGSWKFYLYQPQRAIWQWIHLFFSLIWSVWTHIHVSTVFPVPVLCFVGCEKLLSCCSSLPCGRGAMERGSTVGKVASGPASHNAGGTGGREVPLYIDRGHWYPSQTYCNMCLTPQPRGREWFTGFYRQLWSIKHNEWKQCSCESDWKMWRNWWHQWRGWSQR